MKLDEIDFAYPGQQMVLDHFSMEVTPGTITCLLGPSGCGKTTLLHVIGGLLKPQKGHLLGFDQEVMSYIFQETRILPWKTALDNVVFPLLDLMPVFQAEELARDLLIEMDMKNEINLFPHQLSGGMKQRVAIARAFAYPSTMILMDEAFTGLDSSLKRNILNKFINTWKNNPRTVICVTHDVEEAMLLAQEMIILGGSPLKILKRFSLSELNGSAIHGKIMEYLHQPS
ncbi:MAG: ATP-binding cassette domain-containing protein [Bacteroidales bacterium]|nr:ATP-binding cassette domain-containing protein [Bacteroidales bacterium]